MGVELFSNIIDSNWLLGRASGYWLVEETAKNSNNKAVLVGGCTTLVFSLDRKGVDSFPFIQANTVKKGMRSVCDAMIVTTYENRTYFCAMDMKSGNEGGATKQIESARMMFDWMIGLAYHHGHWPQPNTRNCFFGIVNLAPRRQVRKGMSRRSAEIPEPEKSPFGDYMVFRLKNHPKVCLPLLIEQLN